MGPNPGPYNTHFAAYGLGWNLSDARGYKVAEHTGGLPDMVTQVVLVPEQRLSIIVLTNQEAGLAFHAVSTTVLDHYLGVTGKDREQEIFGYKQAAAGQTDQALAAV